MARALHQSDINTLRTSYEIDEHENLTSIIYLFHCSSYYGLGRYLKIEKTIRGGIEGSALEEDYDRAYCAFVEMASGCIVRQETGSFCGGQWALSNDAWLWAGEGVSIDQRDQNTASKNSDMEALAEINGDANLHLCNPSSP